MILHLKNSISSSEASKIASELKAFHIEKEGKHTLITGSGLKEVPAQFESKVEQFWAFSSDIQLASKTYLQQKREVTIGKNTIGGQQNKTLIIAGPFLL